MSKHVAVDMTADRRLFEMVEEVRVQLGGGYGKTGRGKHRQAHYVVPLTVEEES